MDGTIVILSVHAKQRQLQFSHTFCEWCPERDLRALYSVLTSRFKQWRRSNCSHYGQGSTCFFAKF